MQSLIRYRGVFWASPILFTLALGLAWGFQSVSGLAVEELSSDSAAAKAGVQPGDRIISYDGKPLPSPAAFEALQQNTFGKKDVVLDVRRGETTLSLTVPLGLLGIEVRPELSPDAERLYEDGKASLKAGKTKEAIAHWEAAAKLTQGKTKAAGAWFLGRAGETLEAQGRWEEAREAHSAAWTILRQSVDGAAQAKTLSALGRCSQNLNDFTAAAKWYEQALHLDLAAGNDVWVAGDLDSLGTVALNHGDLSAAQKYYSRALQIRERLLPNSLDFATSLINLGNVSYQRGDLPAAQDQYKRALQIRERLAPNSLDFAAGLNSLGNVAEDRGDLAVAQDYYSRSLAIRVRLAPNSLAVAASLQNLGILAEDSGDLAAARDYHSRSLAIKERLAPNSLTIADSLTNLGGIAWQRGDLEAAQDYHSRALAIEERLAPNSVTFGMILTNLGLVAYARGDLAAAQDYHSRALAIAEHLAPNSLGVANSLINLGNLAWTRGDLAAAQDYHSRALAIAERLAPNSLDVAGSLNNLGLVAYRRGDLAAARNYYIRALAMQQQAAPDSVYVAESLNNLGEVARGLLDLPAAKDYYNRALQIRERLAPDSMELAETLTNLGNVAFSERHYSDARSLFARAVTNLELQRGRIPSAESRAFLVASYRSAYEGLVQSSLLLNDLPEAFSASERARARSLLDLLTEARLNIRQGVDLSLLERARQLQESLNAKAARQTQLLSGKHTEQEAAETAKEIDSIATEYHAVEAKIRASSPRYASLTQPRPLSLAETQRQVLDKDSLLLEYSLGEDASSLFVVSQDSIKSYQLPKRKEIEGLARQSYAELTARNRLIANETERQRNARILQAEADYPKLAARLSQLILAPAVAELGAKRLLIVADGDLLQIPFGALADPAASAPQPLIVNHEIIALPSASVVAIQRQEWAKRTPAAKQLALFADPVFEQNDERVTVIGSLKDAKVKPEVASGMVARDISFERAVSEAAIGSDRSKIQRLPFSREEANAIFALAQQDETLKALDFDASKDKAAGNELSQYRIVHFATHALLNNDHPELSGIVLSLVDRQGHGVDGFLRLNEIYNLNLPADLVVLSACQTGLGKQIQGEGLIGLTRGFMYAGAQRVVASLWKVDDEATAELMGRFYEKMLKEGEPVAAALRHAEIEMSQQNRWQAAYFWAGFQMQGEWK